MELKLRKDGSRKRVNDSINRTFMELKPRYYTTLTALIGGINRTFMELKLSIAAAACLVFSVLIEPLWN